MACSMSSSVDNDLLIVDLILQFQELAFLNIVTQGRHDSSEDKTTKNSQGLNITLRVFWIECGDDKIKSGCPDQKDDVAIFKLSGQKSVEAFDSRELNGMLTKELDSSLKVFIISNDTSLWIGIKKSA